jgi:SPP1 gp7 family putative phage head morphogenesis protein
MRSVTENEKATIADKMAGINQKQAAASGELVFTPEEIRDLVYGLPPLDPEDALVEAPEDEDVAGDTGSESDNDDADADTSQGNARAASRRTDYRAVHRAADRFVPSVRNAVMRVFASGRDAISLRSLEAGLASNDRTLIENAVFLPLQEVRGEMLAALLSRMGNVLEAGAKIAARKLSGPRVSEAADAPLVAKGPLAFDRTSPQAVAWAELHAAEMVTGITTESRLAVQAIIHRALVDQITTRVAATMIRDAVGLTVSQAEAVANLRERIKISPGQRIMAGKVAIRVPANGLTDEQMSRALTRYAQQLSKQRAVTIARTETMRAANEGQRQMWTQARSQNLLPASAVRVLIATADERTCPVCGPLDGQQAELTSAFEAGEPPFHPNCRCTTGLATRRR